MRLKCENCAFEKEVTEQDYMDSLDCPLCGRTMFHISVYNERKGNQVETDRTDILIESKAIEQMKNDIEVLGNAAAWEVVESMAAAKLRLRYRYYFFKAGGKVPEKEISNKGD